MSLSSASARELAAAQRRARAQRSRDRGVLRSDLDPVFVVDLPHRAPGVPADQRRPTSEIDASLVEIGDPAVDPDGEDRLGQLVEDFVPGRDDSVVFHEG
jgi:hypothetical protein